MTDIQKPGRADSSHRPAILPKLPHGRTYVMGDLHGELSLLEMALDALGFTAETDRLVSVGDLIDRGPRSADSLSLLRLPRFYTVMGNHEATMMAAFNERDPIGLQRWINNGGAWFEEHSVSELQEMIQLIEALPLALEIECQDGVRIGVIHAELPAGRAWPSAFNARLEPKDIAMPSDRRLASAMLWGRRRFTQWRQGEIARDGLALKNDPGVPGIDLMICGHNIVRGPRVPVCFGNVLHLDTGAFEPDGALTLWNVDSGDFLQICKRRDARPFINGPFRTLS